MFRLPKKTPVHAMSRQTRSSAALLERNKEVHHDYFSNEDLLFPKTIRINRIYTEHNSSSWKTTQHAGRRLDQLMQTEHVNIVRCVCASNGSFVCTPTLLQCCQFFGGSVSPSSKLGAPGLAPKPHGSAAREYQCFQGVSSVTFRWHSEAPSFSPWIGLVPLQSALFLPRNAL